MPDSFQRKREMPAALKPSGAKKREEILAQAEVNLPLPVQITGSAGFMTKRSISCARRKALSTNSGDGPRAKMKPR